MDTFFRESFCEVNWLMSVKSLAQNLACGKLSIMAAVVMSSVDPRLA